MVGGATSYTWLASDPTDTAANQALHTGLVKMNGTTNSFIDLVQTTGPNSIGQSLPILFTSSTGSGASYGWSVDLVIKLGAVQTWSKLFDLGTGAYVDSFYMGWYSNANTIEAAQYITTTNQLAQMATNNYATQAGSSYITTITPFLSSPVLNQWYHLAWVLQPTSQDQTYATAAASVSANWTVYVNGQPVANNANGNFPMPVFRHVSYLGRSDWFQEGTGDAMMNATYDAFRIWNRALSSSQVSQLANAYGLNVQPVTGGGGDAGLASALGAGAKMPVFNANFSVNPTSISGVGSSLNYGWAATDSSDTSANQQLHQGVAILSGTGNSFINLSTLTGPQSCGQLLPLLGGASSGTGATVGWSFEFVFKPTGNTNTWAKLVDFGDGSSSGYYPSSNNDWTLGFDGSDLTQFLLETYNAGALTPNFTHGWVQMETLQVGTWYHITVVQTPVGSLGGANWYVYVNGALLQLGCRPSTAATPVTVTPTLRAPTYPQPIFRSQAYIGKSGLERPPAGCHHRRGAHLRLRADADADHRAGDAVQPQRQRRRHWPQPSGLPRAWHPGRQLRLHPVHHCARVCAGHHPRLRLRPLLLRPLLPEPRTRRRRLDWVHLGAGGPHGQRGGPGPAPGRHPAQRHHQHLRRPGAGDRPQLHRPVSAHPLRSVGGHWRHLRLDGRRGVQALQSQQTWSKIFDLGTGANIDDIYFGWQGSSGHLGVRQHHLHVQLAGLAPTRAPTRGRALTSACTQNVLTHAYSSTRGTT